MNENSFSILSVFFTSLFSISFSHAFVWYSVKICCCCCFFWILGVWRACVFFVLAKQNTRTPTKKEGLAFFF